ncbi:triose-phosphate isomerase [Muricomes intestini]|uniref:triose-phosphate isomerase n=2 Tax=Muricomes intestini TaxID=1796634 RepID=UPI002FE3CADA
MQKKLYFGSNLKMYKNIQDTVTYLQDLVSYTKDISREEIELFIIPSYTSLESATKSIEQSYIKIGAQNMCWEDEGQFTGEISPLMLKELGISLVMIGHSERRHVLGETDSDENKKVKAALNHGFTTLLCIGETAGEKDFGISTEVLRTQLKIGFHDVPASQTKNIWVAYEPVWSIGVNGTPASADYAESMHKEIKKALLEIFGDAGKDIPVLYGGSVNPGNADELIIQPSIDGLFTGRAAWQADKFNTLIRNAKATYEENSRL